MFVKNLIAITLSAMLLYTAVESPKDFSNVAESSMAVMQLLLKESEESKKSKKLEESKKSEE